jgi:capsular polysaccharide biosynthesis protein
VTRSVWRVEDDGDTQLPVSPTAEGGLVSLPFLVAAVRRRWRRIAVTAGVFAVLALAAAQFLGGQQAATTTLLLTHDPAADPASAMATDLSLLRTRTVSEEVVDRLHLRLEPEAFAATVSAEQPSDQLMKVTVTAPSAQEATRRVTALASVYLEFRGRQIGALADATVRANQQRIDNINRQIADLTKRYESAAAAGPAAGRGQTATTLLTERAQLQAEVDDAERANAQTKLQNEAIIKASHVVDAAAVVHTSRLKAAVMTVMSGLIGGAALGLGLVLAPAVLSTRLNRREDVARALGLSVRFSAGPVSGRWWWLPGREARRNAETLAHGLATALPEDADTARLTVATVGAVRDGAYVIGALADGLARESTAVAVVDLSTEGVLAKRSRRPFAPPDPIRNRQLVKVHRQDLRVSELASRGRVGVGSDKDLGKAEVILTLAELDLGVGVDALGDLADVSVVLVRAGGASAERLRSSATLLRQSGLRPAFAMLVGTDGTDDSSGLQASAGQRDVTARRSS